MMGIIFVMDVKFGMMNGLIRFLCIVGWVV